MKRKHGVVVNLTSGAPISPSEPLPRAQVKGWVKAVFWGLRVYIAIMLVLVVIGLAKGSF
ncbi:hypothetical protein IW967_13840 [Alicyclobacillus mali]|uniref:Uncharacterized protein n=1 Tax=Alicyclobacillus mali (ex Roth et al. 2021) TaxID=1123961 RepID=A0ABS0F6N5_9BACL|nr:hypothetical protein [Alicyclobacillus mali (ex Roth et al. 2021)]MBF8378933.1 hypothetical protein [Alicyclobacillus mali (ex Roth et al. 2021)]MCL6487324.1 hypothetical protein [Alicyclobacillus mali (ex Roth et al. 2021)]